MRHFGFPPPPPILIPPPPPPPPPGWNADPPEPDAEIAFAYVTFARRRVRIGTGLE